MEEKVCEREKGWLCLVVGEGISVPWKMFESPEWASR